MNDPFIIFALPRSRTAWLSAFLTYGGWACMHEQAITLRTIEDITDFFRQPNIGTVETAAAQGWWLLKHYVPNLRMAVIQRPVEDVVRSMMGVDIAPMRYNEAILRRSMPYGVRMLKQISEHPGVLTLDYEDLATEEGCASLFEHCLQTEFDASWWRHMQHKNIQIDVKSVLIYYHANRESVENFKRLTKSELRRLAYAGVIRKAA